MAVSTFRTRLFNLVGNYCFAYVNRFTQLGMGLICENKAVIRSYKELRLEIEPSDGLQLLMKSSLLTWQAKQLYKSVIRSTVRYGAKPRKLQSSV